MRSIIRAFKPQLILSRTLIAAAIAAARNLKLQKFVEKPKTHA